MVAGLGALLVDWGFVLDDDGDLAVMCSLLMNEAPKRSGLDEARGGIDLLKRWNWLLSL